MHSSKALLILVAASAFGADFSGSAALEYTQKAVAFGVRPAASPANLKLQAYIEAQLKPLSCQLTYDSFTAQTPIGPVPMKNIIARFPGKSGVSVAVTGHFDTKPMPGVNFLGANDGGSSAGFLLELARVVATMPHNDDILLVWFDGEEAYGNWSDTNGIFGSRHLAQKWAQDGTARKVKALINVDMIGDKDLDIIDELNSSRSLRNTVWQTAKDLGYERYFLPNGFATEDDHMPFIREGINSLDLIDFDYGPSNTYWHTEKDTIDKLSAHSLQVVGDVVVAVLRKLTI